MNKARQSGFTAVELLITLFVAAAFLIAAYQLFNYVIKDGGQARAESRAANVAYDYMRRYSPYAAAPCVAVTPLSNSPITVDGLADAKVTVAITCPDYSTSNLSKVSVTLTFNDPQQSVTYSTFANGSGALTTDVTDGLIAWWKLNGTVAATQGVYEGAGSFLVPTTGQNGQPNGAYTFNGSSSAITFSSTFGLSNTNVTLSMWVKPSAASGSGAFFKIGGNGYGVGMGATTFDNSNPGTKIIMLFEGVRWIGTTQDLGTGWHHIVMQLNSSGVPSVYRDGTLVGSYSGTNANVPTSTSWIGAGNASGRFFSGDIDDVRVYNRVLSSTEILSLYIGGGK